MIDTSVLVGEVLENMVHILENVPDDLVVGVHGQLQVSQQGLVAILSTRGGMVPLCSDSTCERSSPILLSSPFWTTTYRYKKVINYFWGRRNFIGL